MPAIYLHDHKNFPDLLNIVGDKEGIDPGLIEKDYWIMQSLYGLKNQGYDFQLKGGTSLSKGFGLIERFSEDIDMHINPPKVLEINENPQNSKPKNIEKKKNYYDQLAREIKIDGITQVYRDEAFDDKQKYNSGGIRLIHKKFTKPIEGVKEGILLEAGYDTVAPNTPITITSWAYEFAKMNPKLELIDNRAKDILCYDHRYTFVEKLQTIATKFRKEIKNDEVATNYMRQYYDVYCLLGDKAVKSFIGSKEYRQHKQKRFSKEDFALQISENEAFLLNDTAIRERLQKRYEGTRALYYKGQPRFEDVMKRIAEFVERL